MFKLNLIVAYRSLLRNRFYAFINIFGLALGLATCLLISIYIIDESAYDSHWTDSDRIYRVAADLKFNDNEFNMAVSPAPMADAFREELPELAAIGRMQNVGSDLIKVGDQYFDQDEIAFSDPEILDIFKFELVQGSFEKVFEQPSDAILSRSTSQKLFGSVDCIGQRFELDGFDFEVKAVYEDLPPNTHFHYELILAMEVIQSAKSPVWLSNNFRTYLLLDEVNDPQTIQDKFPSLLERYVGPQLQELAGVDMETFLASGGRLQYYLQPIEDIHLKSDLQYEIEANGNQQFVFIFLAAGLFVLIIAVINFMNISTARSSMRAKEVGLRKVMGSKRKLLIGQFITESVLNTFLAMILAVFLLYLALPFFNFLTEKTVTNPLFGSIQLWDEVLIALLVVGFLSGIYPAFYLSGFLPINVLKGDLRLGLRSGGLRNVLVITQFSASVILIFGALVIFSQLKYSMNKSLGFDKDEVLVINDTYYLGEKVEAFKQELLNHTSVINATMTSFLPIEGNRSDTPLMPKAETNTDGALSLQNWVVDAFYVPTLKLTIAQGRNFDPNLASDSSAIIINQSAADRFGFENPIGEKIKTMGGFQIGGRSEFTIIGVVEDFHIDNFRSAIGPQSLYLGRSTGAISLRFEADKVSDILQLVESKWDEFSPNIPLSYSFMDQQFEDQYQSEERLSMLFSIFATLAILIACLGLFGLAAFTTDQKKKELGIRKVLGASIQNLMILQLSAYTRMLLIAILVSLPIAYYITSLWLESFVYRTQLNAFTFVIPGVLVLALAWTTVSMISLAASRRNPVENLKYE